MDLDHFDETDKDSYYFKGLDHNDAMAILKDESEGVFLLRDSTRGSGHVICVKEGNTVMEYLVATHPSGTKLYIREEYPFKDLPALLSFYKQNIFRSTPLIRPVSKEKVLQHKGPINVLHRMTMPEFQAANSVVSPDQSTLPGSHIHSSRISAPPIHENPLYVRVTKARIPIALEVGALPLKVGDKIRVTSRKNGQGYGEIIGTQKSGKFPMTHVEILKDVEKWDAPESN